jgi:large conductance mechanosensitive channel
MGFVKDFKTFILRGSVVDLAVGVVIGAAFTAVVTAFTKDLLTPLIGIAGKFNFSDLAFTVNGSKFMIGDFINAVIGFLITAFVVFSFVVKPVNWLMARRKTEVAPDPTTRECPYCVSNIPIKATRCPFCTSEVSAAA